MKKLKNLLFLVLCSSSLCAQSPGGVDDPQLWFQTKPVLATNLSGSYRWLDVSGNAQQLNYYHTYGAGYGTEFTNPTVRYYNGSPALNLDYSNNLQSREVLLKRTNLSQATIFGTFAPNNYFNREVMLFGLNGRAGQGVFLGSDKIYSSIESNKDPLDYGSSEGMDLMFANGEDINVNYYREKSMRIVAYYRSLPPVTGIWGEKEQSVLTFNSSYLATNKNNTSTFNIPAASNLKFYGYIPEVIVYSRMLTLLERRKVDTYLAIKYGISLPVSYIGSNDKLLWDIDENDTYSNRITAILEDDKSNLCLREASTSYQELPYYADYYDYYQGNSPYSRSSMYRLLVMGRAHGNQLEDGEYIIWGDNNAIIPKAEATVIAGIKTMPRHWLLQPNIQNTLTEELQWEVENLDIEQTDDKGFTYKITRKADVLKGTLKTQTPLKGKNGYLAATYNNSNYRNPLGISFESDGCSYGYKIHTNGYIYKFINDKLTAPTLPYTNGTIEVEKEGNTIFLRIAGVRQPTFDIAIDQADEDKSFYGKIVMERYSNILSTLLNFRHGGFVDTGNKVELSYAIASEFGAYTNIALKKSFLIIDRSGTGEFRKGNIEYLNPDEVDATRRKLIFNNVFWDTDKNGKDVFTFGYKPASIIAEIYPTNPECKDELSQNNGNIQIIMKEGIKGFAYTLTNTETGDARSNEYFNDSIVIDSLCSGLYNLTIKEIGGTNFRQNQSATTAYQPAAVTSTRFTTTTNAYLDWIAPNATTQAAVAFMHYSNATGANPINATFDNGVYINGLNLYAIVNKIQETTPFVTIKPGDHIKIERYSNQLWLKVNEEQVAQRTVPTSGYIYGAVRVDNPEGEIMNMKWNRINAGTVWSRTANLLTEISTDDQITREIVLDVSCKESLNDVNIIPDVIEDKEEKINRMQVLQIEGSQSVKARVTSEQPEIVSFLVYDLNGSLIQRVNKPTPQTVQEADLDTRKSGVFIIKAITNTEEYTKKVIVK